MRLAALSLLIVSNVAHSQELFADYFDINTASQAGTVVNGQINLKSNYLAHKSPQPLSYQFKIIDSDSDIFELNTVRDSKNRLFGRLSVADGRKVGNQEGEQTLTIGLFDGDALVSKKRITINIADETLQQNMLEFYKPISLKETLLWGRKVFTSQQVKAFIDELEANDGQFVDSWIYRDRAWEQYGANGTKGSIEFSQEERTQFRHQKYEVDLLETSKTIGGLGRSYALDDEYKGSEALKRALYKALLQFANAIPVLADDVMIDGQPIGEHYGDGFAKLHEKPLKALSWSLSTHQWDLTDALIVPSLYLIDEMKRDIAAGDTLAKSVHEALLRLFQINFAVVPPRRQMDAPNQRWGDISSQFSNGAWSDANIGHRIRSINAFPIIWNDYNRPLTYVPYWYDEFYNHTEFKGKSFAKGWSPKGALKDLSYWSSLFSVPAKNYWQSGFHPDGTVSHHVGGSIVERRGSDLPMTSYGYEWMMKVRYAAGLLKEAPETLTDDQFQFVIDRFNYSYQRMIYKGTLDFVTAGRSSMDDQKRWVNRNIPADLDFMLSHAGSEQSLVGAKDAVEFTERAKKGINRFSATTSFFNGDYLVHRRQNDSHDFFFSLKQKSRRTMGAEDFSKTRKTWHLGSGVLQLKTVGDEYRQDVRLNWDFHAVPGVTEEWRNDPFPKGSAYLAGSARNNISGLLSDGEFATTIYEHQPFTDYSTAQANKSYFFAGNRAIAFGNQIERVARGQGKSIITTLDQTVQREPIFYNVNGKKGVVEYGDFDLRFEITEPSWFYHQQKGYLIMPQGASQIVHLQTGSVINTTDPKPEKLDQLRRRESKFFSRPHNYLLAISHGEQPQAGANDAYHYALLANVSEGDMDAELKAYQTNVRVAANGKRYHLVEDKQNKLVQITTTSKASVPAAQGMIEVSDAVAMQYVDLGGHIRVSLLDPTHDFTKSDITISLPFKLRPGKYRYASAGIHPKPAEYVHVTQQGQGSTLRFDLADDRDGEIYAGQQRLFAGAPIVVQIPSR